MRLFTLTSLILVSILAKAETFQCVFAEPFMAVTYESDNQRILVQDSQHEEPGILIGVKLEIVGLGKMQVVNSDKEVILTLNHDNKGSIDNTTRRFPFSAVFSLPSPSAEDKHLAGPHTGGCESSLLKNSW